MYYLLVPVCYTSICNRISSSLSPRIVDSELVQQLVFFPIWQTNMSSVQKLCWLMMNDINDTLW